MNQEQTSEQKINLLLNVINTTIKIPKLTEVIVGSGKDKHVEHKATGNIEISLLNNEEVQTLKNVVVTELMILFPQLKPAPQPVAEVNPNQTVLPLEEKQENVETEVKA